MPVYPQSGSVPQGDIIDLTASESASRAPSLHVAPLRTPTQLEDLTNLDPSPRDHMHVIVSLLRPGASEDRDTLDAHRKGRVAENINSTRGKAQSSLPQNSSIRDKQAYGSVDTLSLERSGIRVEEPRMGSAPSASSQICRSGTYVVDQQQVPKSTRTPVKPFLFLDFPPEIRNCVYKMLLTNPKAPIEFPEPTGRNRALRAASWEKCTTRKLKRMHKTIFLEILEVSKQLHAEGSGILYGCNVFKYRSDCGKGPQRVILPTHHLQLLKHIKISAISKSPHIGQDQWVAELVEHFVKNRLRLETFEITWFGWKRYHLRANGPVCRALLCLDVQKLFVIKITGEARMEKKMEEELEQGLRSERIEVRRPVKPVTGEELSDEDEVQQSS